MLWLCCLFMATLPLPLQATAWSPQAAAPPAFLLHHRLLSSGLGCCFGDIHGLYLLQASSTAALETPLWLHLEICKGQPAPPWASPGLQGAAALRLEHLLPSFCTDLDGCRAVLSCLTPLSQLLLCSSFSISSVCSLSTLSITHGSALATAGPCWSSCSCSAHTWGTAGLCSHRTTLKHSQYKILDS